MSWNKNDLIPKREITDGITEETVKFAERFGEYLGKDEGPYTDKKGRRIIEKGLTTSQLRKYFGEIKRQEMQGFNKSNFVLLKPKLAYAVSRAYNNASNSYEFKIKDFYYVITNAMEHVTDANSFKNFISVFEAIVAFHKAAESKQKRDK